MPAARGRMRASTAERGAPSDPLPSPQGTGNRVRRRGPTAHRVPAPAPEAQSTDGDSMAFPRQLLEWYLAGEGHGVWEHADETIRTLAGSAGGLSETRAKITETMGVRTGVLDGGGGTRTHKRLRAPVFKIKHPGNSPGTERNKTARKGREPDCPGGWGFGPTPPFPLGFGTVATQSRHRPRPYLGGLADAEPTSSSSPPLTPPAKRSQSTRTGYNNRCVSK